jgi:5-methylcytosine-specific restriction endonuclease McrA
MGKRVYDWAEVQRYYDAGNGFLACRRRFGVTHFSWCKAIARGALRIATARTAFSDQRRRYDWTTIQAYYDDGHTFRECKAKFGFNAASWDKARKRGDIRPRPRATPLETLLVERGGSRHTLKTRLLSEGAIINRCDLCGLREWRGKPLSMHLDHINGVSDDHRFENLRMLCPNCHSQTETYGGKNVRLRHLQERAQVM